MNKVAAVAWGLADWTNSPLSAAAFDAIPLADIRAELREHGLFIRWDPGIRPGRHPGQPGFKLTAKGGRQIALGTLPECCRAALIHTGIAQKEDT